MKVMNMPARKLRRQIRAEEGKWEYPDDAIAQERKVRTKIRRNSRRAKTDG
jgi:hypothetical protein